MQLPHINRFGWDSQMQHRNLEVVSHSWYAANSFRVRGSIKAHKGFADSGHDTSVFNPLEESSSSQETSHLSPRGGGSLYNGLYGEAPPERGTFFRLQVYKRVRISQV